MDEAQGAEIMFILQVIAWMLAPVTGVAVAVIIAAVRYLIKSDD